MVILSHFICYLNNIKIGHIGALCEDCDIHGRYWGESYTKVGNY